MSLTVRIFDKVYALFKWGYANCIKIGIYTHKNTPERVLFCVVDGGGFSRSVREVAATKHPKGCFFLCGGREGFSCCKHVLGSPPKEDTRKGVFLSQICWIEFDKKSHIFAFVDIFCKCVGVRLKVLRRKVWK